MTANFKESWGNESMRVIALCLLLSMASCSAVGGKGQLYQAYEEYKAHLDSEDYKVIVNDLITKRNREKLKGGAANFDDQFPILSDLNAVLVKKISHYQKIEGSRGCLTLNGLDAGSEPTAIHLEYVKEGGTWRLNYAQIAYLESKNDYKNTAICPLKPPAA